MVELRVRTDGDSTLAYLEQIASASCVWEPSELGGDFFGDDWILPQAFWEALQTDRIDELAARLPRLQEQPFGVLYYETLVAEQGTQIAQGAIEAVLAACRYAQHFEPPAVAEPLRCAAAWFDRAWPAVPVNGSDLRQRDDPWFAAYAERPDGAPAVAQSLGFWTAWDLFDRLLGPTRDNASGRRLAVTALPGRLALPCRTARVPLLLYDEREAQGRVALLTVTLVRDNGCAFCPDPLAMGLTALRKRPVGTGDEYDAFRDLENIHDSMQRIWRLAGLTQSGYRGRWSVTALTGETIDSLAKPSGGVPLIETSLSGRSAEAAVCCALWSALGYVPGEKPEHLLLDGQATITARIDARDLPENPRDLPLATVEGVPAKLRAAKGHVQMVLAACGQQYGTPPPGLDVIATNTLGEAFERLLAMHRHVRNYQDHVDAQWQKQWATGEGQGNFRQGNGGPAAADNPPFIESQGIQLLTETENPRGYLQPSSFRNQRLGTPGSGTDADKWVGIDRDQFLGQAELPGCDLRRAVLTTDAGIGKTSNLEWLHWKINATRDGRLALLVPINKLAGCYDQFLPETLVACFRRDVAGNSAEHLDQTQARLILRRLRDAGQIVLLFDALDQTSGDASEVRTLCEVVSHPEWQRCRIVVAGRPHALVRHWVSLLDRRHVGWRYFRLAEFAPDQQETYLGLTASGESRYQKIRREAREILGTPRVLEYLRKLTDAQLRQIRTPSDVYFHSLRHLITQGMENDETARAIGLPAGARPPSEVTSDAVDRAFELLSAIGFEMTSRPSPSAEGQAGGGAPLPNFDQIRTGDFKRFVRRVRQRIASLPEPTTPVDVGVDIPRLAALNGILQHGFFDSGDRGQGLQQILWRNRSLQEFFAAYWMSQFCVQKDLATLDSWVYLPDEEETDWYYWIWRYAAEMPEDGRDSDVWWQAMSPLYRPGDGQTARRSNEMIYRSWPAMEQYAAGRGILKRFMSEFEQIKDGKRGTPEQQQAAAEFADRFETIPAGTFKLGRPKGKEVEPDEEAYERELRKLVNRTAEEIFESGWPRGRFSGPDGREQHEQIRTIVFSTLSEPNGYERLARMLTTPQVDDEVLEECDRKQVMTAFQFCRDPTLNRWYRLFDPLHGLRAWYQKQEVNYARYSPDPDTPVIYVTWYDAWVFCRWARWDGRSCQLPSERQWEYAAKAGADDLHYWWGDEFEPTKCNAGGAEGRTTVPDDSHCNNFGMRDILGNVWEWCEDWYGEYNAALPNGPETGSSRVSRGGSWDFGAVSCRSAYRSGGAPGFRDVGLGFRPARSSVSSSPVECRAEPVA